MSFLRNSFIHLRQRAVAVAHRSRAFGARHKRVVLASAAVFAVVLVVASVYAVGFARDVLSGLPEKDQLRTMGRMAQSTTLFDMTDEAVFTISKEERLEVPLGRVSPRVVQALIAIEDQRFYEHSGVDPIRLAGAAWNNLRERRKAQGASTITQQLARQTFLTPDKTLRRKLREMVLAARIERLFTKREILELYLNKVYFGDGLYGIDAAARGYFAKPASDVSLSEAALLAGLVKSPSTWAPTVNLDRAVSRRNLVLQQMLETKMITRAEFEQAKAERVRLQDGLRRDEAWGQHFKEQVRRELVARFGSQKVNEGGLRVYTTIDPNVQRAAEAAVSKTLEEIETKRAAQQRRAAKRKGVKAAALQAEATPKPTLEAAVVAVEPETGYVRALVGGRNFAESRFNRAVQAKRQPGSAFKPLVYAAALESGFTPATLVENLNEPISTPEGDWVPEDEHWDGSPMTVRTALRTSSNRAAVQVLQQVGIARTVDYAKKLGLGSVPSVPSLALGSGEVTPLSLAFAYVPFASRGQAHTPILIRRVEARDGTVLFSALPTTTQVLSPTTAFLMTQMMADVINAGTAYKARTMGFRLPAAGKTGTTNDFGDAWFVGYTPHMLAAVWVGFDQPQTILDNGFGGDLAVPLWARLMTAATKGHDPDWYTPPSGVTSARVCRLSGQLAAPGCEHVTTVDNEGVFQVKSTIYTEYFVRGTEPIDQCRLHRDPSFFQRVVGIFDTPPPGESGAPPGAAEGTSGDAAAPPAAAAARADGKPTKKKGFWGKVWGFMKGDEDKKDENKDPKKNRKKNEGGKDEGGGPGGAAEKEPW